MKMISPVYNEKDPSTHVGFVMKSEIHGIELFARMIVRNDVGDESSRSLTLFEAVDEQHVECGVVLTQPSQETQDDLDVDEPHSLSVMKQCDGSTMGVGTTIGHRPPL
jgi:hypothetical protein